MTHKSPPWRLALRPCPEVSASSCLSASLFNNTADAACSFVLHCSLRPPSPGSQSSPGSGVCCGGRAVTTRRRSRCENNRYPYALLDISSWKVRLFPPQQTSPFIYISSLTPKMSPSVIFLLLCPPPPLVHPPPLFSASQRRVPLIPPYIHHGDHRFVSPCGQHVIAVIKAFFLPLSDLLHQLWCCCGLSCLLAANKRGFISQQQLLNVVFSAENTSVPSQISQVIGSKVPGDICDYWKSWRDQKLM